MTHKEKRKEKKRKRTLSLTLPRRRKKDREWLFIKEKKDIFRDLISNKKKKINTGVNPCLTGGKK